MQAANPRNLLDLRLQSRALNLPTFRKTNFIFRKWKSLSEYKDNTER